MIHGKSVYHSPQVWANRQIEMNYKSGHKLLGHSVHRGLSLVGAESDERGCSAFNR
jgi:hypothetical protein